MAELAFVGLGLGDEQDVPPRALAALRAAGAVFAEEYTAVALPGALDRLGAAIGRPIVRLTRAELEGERPILEALARSARVALVVVGDPFAATTHVSLRLAAERAGHSWRYYPNATILTAAAGFLGLSPYRFGRTVSLPFPAAGFRPRSPLERLAENRDRGLHSLVLLDLAPEGPRFLTAGEALGLLRELDPDGATLPDPTPVAVAARVGREDVAGFYGPFGRMRSVDFGPPMHAVVVPAPELHFEEEAALARFRVA